MSNLLYVVWDINPEIINGLPIRYYSVLWAVGLLLAASVMEKMYKKESKPENLSYTLFLYCFVGIVFGARVGHCLFYEPDYYLSHPLEIILPFRIVNDDFTWTGYQGLASHGGTLGLMITLILFSRKTKENLIETLDKIAIVTPITASCIRFANLMNSEIIGKPTDVPWAFVFTSEDLVPRHPAQLYEALAYLLLFFIMIYLYKKYHDKLHKGFYFGLCLTYIFTFRFFIELLKENQVAFESGMTFNMGQLLSIPFVIIGVYFLFFYKSSKYEKLKAVKVKKGQ